jgi:chromosome partitioning protein
MEDLVKENNNLSSRSSMNLSLLDLSEFLQQSLSDVKEEVRTFLNMTQAPAYLPPELVREFLSEKGYKYPQKTISIQMLKGGVAKTTSVLNIGIRAAMYGAKVLFVDLDQQANLTFALGHENENAPVWLDIFEKRKTVDECIVKVNENIDLIPSSLNNSVLERVLINSNRNWSQAVKSPLDQVKLNYDLILIDTAPALSALNTAVTVASDEVIMPVNPDKFSILGFEKNKSELDEIKKDFKLKCEYRILFTKFDGREKMSTVFLEQFIEKYPESMMKNFVRISSEAKNTLGTSKSIFSTKSSVKEDYNLVSLEILGF